MDPLKLEALSLAKGLPASASSIERVARRTTPEASRWAFTQWELRSRARSKFARAAEMLFTREALEQATHECVASYHASQFPHSVEVADLTCGIGADLIGIAGRGPAIGYEVEPERAECAEWNLGVYGVGAKVEVRDCFDQISRFQYAFADPARRIAGRRSLDPSEFSPDPNVLATHMKAMDLGGLKLSPLLEDDFLESLRGRIEFVSFGGECREALVWLGKEAGEGRYAVLVETGSRIEAGAELEATEEPDAFFYEADPAAIRAHALSTLAEELNLTGLATTNGYLTGGKEVRSPWLKSYRVLHHGPADLKQTSAALRNLGSATPELKQRGAKQDLAGLSKKLKLDGSRRTYVAIWPLGEKLKHTVLEPL